MQTNWIYSYFENCFLLLVPILLWNIILAGRLPKAYSAEIFSKDIPPFTDYGEKIFRFFVFALSAFMPIRIETQSQKIGLGLYLAGTIIYFLSWLVLIYFPQTDWSLSAFGFSAPAYTPLIWLAGIGLIGGTLYFSSPYRSWMYFTLSIIFIGFHLSHILLVYLKNIKQPSNSNI